MQRALLTTLEAAQRNGDIDPDARRGSWPTCS